jgi:hypothetical protein
MLIIPVNEDSKVERNPMASRRREQRNIRKVWVTRFGKLVTQNCFLWVQDFLRTYKVCLSENPDRPLSWSNDSGICVI